MMRTFGRNIDGMRTPRFPAEALAEVLREQKIATLGQLAATLGPAVERTVFRKLRELASRSSYSHRGRYYTLDNVADFDEDGLWSYESVWFSVHGTLLATAEAIVDACALGRFVDELDNAVHVGMAPGGCGSRWCIDPRAANTAATRRLHGPIANEAGRPSSVMRFKMLHAMAASVSWAMGCRARSRPPMIDLYRKKAFSTRACRW